MRSASILLRSGALAAVAAAVALDAPALAGTCGACDAGGVCDLQVGINGDFIQDCGDGQWVGVGFPFDGDQGFVDTVTSVHNTNTDRGSIYIVSGTCTGPDIVNGVLATLCCAIEGEAPGTPVDHCFPAVDTTGLDKVWVVMVPHVGFAFDVAYNSATTGTAGAGYGSLDASGTTWQDLNDFGFGACYCVSLSSTGCSPAYDCDGGGPVCPGDGDCCAANGTPGCDDLDCCEAVCAIDSFCCEVEWDGICADEACGPDGVCDFGPDCPAQCAGDINGSGAVDGADLGLLLGAWGSDDPCANLSGDGNVDGNDLGILLGAWGPCPLECGTAGTGDCCMGNGTPYCDDADCCDTVCAADPFCCDSEWDAICAEEACGPDGLCFQEFGCSACAGGGGAVCDLQVGINGGFTQECLDDQWTGLAFPIQTGGATIDTVTSVHNTNTGIGTIYIVSGGCDAPDVQNGVLRVLGGAIEAEPAGVPVEHCFDPLETSATDPTWIVMIPHTGFAFDVAYDSDTAGAVGTSYGSLDASGTAWQDLNDFGFGACYCVSLSFTGCEPPEYDCPNQGGGCPANPACPGDGGCGDANGTPGCDDEACCNCVCQLDPFCCDVEWDANCALEAIDEPECGLTPVPCTACDGGQGNDCDTQVGVDGAFVQECEDGQWVSLAFPIQTGGAQIDTVTSVHNTNTGLGSIYICAGTCDGPDVVGGILATLCCAIEAEAPGQPVNHCFPAISTSATDPTWIVMTFHTGFSFDVAFDSGTMGAAGTSYGNLDGGTDPSLWQDLDGFGFGGCYCVGLSFANCSPPTYECPPPPAAPGQPSNDGPTDVGSTPRGALAPTRQR